MNKFIEFNIEINPDEHNGEASETIRIYPMDVLLNTLKSEFIEDELEEFICGSWLYVSFSVGSVLYALGKDFSEAKSVYDMMHTDEDWFKKVKWTKEQRLAFEADVYKLLKKFLDYDDEEAWREVRIWSGLGSVPQLDDYSEENYREYMRLFDERAGFTDEDDEENN